MYIKLFEWSVMEEVYGLDDNGNIMVPDIFTKDMEKLIPKNRILKVVKYDYGDGIIGYYDHNNKRYTFSREMVSRIFKSEKEYIEYIKDEYEEVLKDEYTDVPEFETILLNEFNEITEGWNKSSCNVIEFIKRLSKEGCSSIQDIKYMDYPYYNKISNYLSYIISKRLFLTINEEEKEFI